MNKNKIFSNMNINYSVDKLHEKIMPIWLAYFFW